MWPQLELAAYYFRSCIADPLAHTRNPQGQVADAILINWKECLKSIKDLEFISLIIFQTRRWLESDINIVLLDNNIKATENNSFQ